ncbi:transcriptional activator protein LysR [Klebsiella pneumoniae]|uniref:Transcriptional activator protein LysR n=1 Tax=Klebsiella pneumoniae TaxID=573 RepID=A0A4P0YFH3_KLEPN|nr:transcriptional activator protein LysR [Klebsiella pneumoniae]
MLGLQLFERTRGRLQPTVQGLRLFEEVQRSWYGLDRIVSAAESLREFRQGELSIACLPVFSQSFLPLLLPRFSLAIRRSACRSSPRSRRCWRSGSPPSAMTLA